MHLAQGGARELDRRDDVVWIAFHEHDVGALHRNVGASADGKSDVRLSQRGRVVDAVADHPDLLARRLQLLDLLGFLPGQYVGEYARDPEVRGDSLGGARVVAGQHHHFDTALPQLCHGGLGGGSHRVSDGNESEHTTALRHVDHGSAFALQSSGVGFE